MKKLLYIFPLFASILLVNLVSAYWWNNYDYYNDHNYETLYDLFNHKTPVQESRQVVVIEENHDWYNKPKDVEYYTVPKSTWLNKKDVNTKSYETIYVKESNRYPGYNQNNYNSYSGRYINKGVYQTKILYKNEIQYVECIDDKCYIAYKKYYKDI